MDPLNLFLIGLSLITAFVVIFHADMPRRFRKVFVSGHQNDRVSREARWVEFEITNGYQSAQNDWTVPSGCADLKVTGTSFNLKSCLSFLAHIDPESASLVIERASYNAEQMVPALRVLGYPTKKSTNACFLGHVPADVAKQIAQSYPQDWPLGVRFTEAGYKTDRSAVFFKFSLLAKSAK